MPICLLLSLFLMLRQVEDCLSILTLKEMFILTFPDRPQSKSDGGKCGGNCFTGTHNQHGQRQSQLPEEIDIKVNKSPVPA